MITSDYSFATLALPKQLYFVLFSRRGLLRTASLLVYGFLCISCSGQSVKSTSHEQMYLNPKEPIAARVEDLVSRMTLSEKIAQLYNDAPAIERLGIPEYNWWNEALHGVARAGKATVFPQAIGLAATFNAPLLHNVAAAISDEARAKHHYFTDNDVVFRYTGLTFWSPNVNIFRDPRWGRGQETYGEDPFLTGKLAVEFIGGLQGNDPQYLKTAAMAKHFAVHSGPEKSRHSDDYEASPKDLQETYLPAFAMAVKDAQVESVMCAYNRVNGAPACGSDYLLQEVLRGDWGFDGHVVSDCGALADFYDPMAHNVVQAPAEAAAWALKSGTDLNCGTGRLSTFANLHFALQRKFITEADIDQAVTRLFTTRFKLGMFDPKDLVAYTQIPMSVVGSEKHLKLTQTAAEESFVLLKNNGVLPLKKNTRVAVIGPNAQNPAVLLGNYNGDPIKPVTALAGIIHQAGQDNVIYAPGSAIVDNFYGHYAAIPESVFFHLDKNGKTLPGLLGSYFEATQEQGMASTPEFTRVDPNIDFYWPRSPLDDSVWDEFGIRWQGLLKPSESGRFMFESVADIEINGKKIEGSIALEAGKTYSFSASITFLRTWWGNNPLEPLVQVKWINTSTNYTADSIRAAEQADVVVFIAGISPLIEGEEMPVELPGFDHGDRSSITLPKVQSDLLKRLKKTKKPIVLVNFSGSAMALNWENQQLDAILQGFYPGEATGTALANILWGQVSPSGKLPVTFYKSESDLPDFKDYRMANRTYKYFQGEPLFPFGYGLSYSQFQFSATQFNLRQNPAGTPSVEIQYTLKNTGQYQADEVVQVYMHLLDAPVTVPRQELVAFTKVQLKPNEQQQLSLSLDGKKIHYVDEAGKIQAYSGRIAFAIGGGQPGYKGSSNVVTTTVDYP